MPGYIQYVPIAPKLLKTARMRGLILQAMLHTEREVVADFQSTVETWHHSVQFLHKVGFRGGDLIVSVITDDDPWNILNRGTSVRYNVMTRGFIAKTKPGVIGSGPGRGQFAYRDTKNPRPGIQARNFTIAIRKKHDKPFKARIARAIFLGLK
jgi:hypothetical protein